MLIAAVLASIAGFTARAAAERSQEGDIIASLDTEFAPRKLPRNRLAPVTMTLRGSVSTADGSPLPRVKQIQLDVAGSGLLFTRGLPACPEAKLLNVNNALAMSRCRPALVGHGRLDGQVFLEFQKPFVIHARLLAFNGTAGGRPAIWVHAFAPRPPISFVLPFLVQHGSGRFSTELVGSMPGSVGATPHAADFELTIGRRFQYRGATQSYLRASCPVPRRFTAGFFSFAHVVYLLAGGVKIGTEAVRSCRAL